MIKDDGRTKSTYLGLYNKTKEELVDLIVLKNGENRIMRGKLKHIKEIAIQ